jgi:glycosyltransferase involved in cell wall biosynthesis
MRRPKIHLLYDVPGWAYHSYTSALVKYAPPDLQITHGSKLPRDYERYSLVVVLPFPKTPKFYSLLNQHRIPIAINLYIQLPHFEEQFLKARPYCNHVIYNNVISYKYMGEPKTDTYIPNGIDLSIWYDEHKERRDIALLCSSEIFAKLKGVEIAQHIPSIETFVTNSYSPARNKDQMRTWYNTAKVYVCLSETEGTPTPALEAAACGCTVVSTPVGNMPELIEHGYNGFLLYNRDPELIDHLIRNAIFNFEPYAANMQETIRTWDWKLHAELYYDYFRKIMKKAG